MEINKKNIKKLIKEYLAKDTSLVFAYLFGSFVDEDKFKDIDLALYSNKDILQTIEISVELEKITNISFDVIDIKKAPDHLIHSISKGEVIIDNDEYLRIDIITAAWSRYFDFRYYRERFLKDISFSE